jgi:biopolymer transport protein ExbD
VIFVSADEVLVQGQMVAQVADILDGDSANYDLITARLAQLRDNVVGPSTLAVAGSRDVTILADKSVPFIVIRKIMSICTGEGYENVSLAVIQKASQVAAS